MVKIKRKSLNDIIDQNERIQQRAYETTGNADRARRAGEAAARYANNMIRVQGGGNTVSDPNRRFTRNQYMGIATKG